MTRARSGKTVLRGRKRMRKLTKGFRADGIYAVLTDEKLRRGMVHKGIARAGMFSWEQSVRRIRAIYREVGA